jgi:hypothetical protein
MAWVILVRWIEIFKSEADHREEPRKALKNTEKTFFAKEPPFFSAFLMYTLGPSP